MRLIAPDRPGVGLSSGASGYTVADYPGMVAELADAMGIERFGVWGYSGGGPYAVASRGEHSAASPRRRSRGGHGTGRSVGEGRGLREDRPPDARARGASPEDRPVDALGDRALARLSPKSAAKSFSKQLSEADRKVADDLGDPREMIALFTHAFLRGGRGVVDDYRAIGQPWGVDLAAISVPVRIFQGDADTMVPARHAEELVQRIPGAELVRWPGEGHLAPITHTPEILDWLRQW